MANLTFNPSEMSTFYYEIDTFKISIPGYTDESIPATRIANFDIIKNFDDLFFPVFRVSLALSSTLLYRILENKLNVKFTVRLIAKELDVDKNELSRDEVFNTIFTAYIDEDTPNLDKDLIEQAHDVTNTGENSTPLSDFGSHLELYLFKENDMDVGKAVTNFVAKNADVGTVLTYLLSAAGANNVIMSKPYNTNAINEILVPPYSLVGAMDFIDKCYGIFSTYSTIFFDYDYKYILSRELPCSAWYPGENTRITLNIASDSSAETFYSGSRIQDKIPIVNITKNASNFSKGSVTRDQIVGNNTVVIDQSTGNTTSVSTSSDQRGTGNTQIVVNKYPSNPYITQYDTQQKQETALVMSANIKDCNINYFTPNKEFNVVVDETQAMENCKGLYRLNFASFSFTKSGDDFRVNANLCFFKNK